MSERKNEAEINLLNTQADALKAETGKNKEETQSIIEKRIWEVKQEMFKGWTGFINTANQLWDQMVKWQPTEKTTIDGKEVEIPKYFEIEDDKFGKIVFGEESFQGDMMTAEKQILEGTAAIKTLESIYADEKLSAEIKKINADARSKKENRRGNRRPTRASILDRDSKHDHQASTSSRKSTYRDWETDRKSTRLNSSHRSLSRMPSSA